jgi:hypothetical protein
LQKKHEKEKLDALKLDMKDQSEKAIKERKKAYSTLAEALMEEHGVLKLKRCETTLARSAIGKCISVCITCIIIKKNKIIYIAPI